MAAQAAPADAPADANGDAAGADADAAAAGPADGPSTSGGGAGGSDAGLDSFRRQPQLRAALEALQTRVENSSVFLRPSPEVAAAARDAAKLLYKLCAATLLGGADGGGGSRAERRALRNSAAAPLPELHTDASFDPEQIWLQLELATDAAVRRVRRLIRTAEPLSAGTAQLVTAEAAAGVEALLRGGDSSGEEEEEEEEGGSSGEGEEDEGEEEEEDEEEEERKRRAKKARRDGGKKAAAAAAGGPGGVEDRFFRLSDMEKYMEDAERRAMRGGEEDEESEGAEGEEGEEGDDDEGKGGMFGDEEDDEEEQQLEALLQSAAAAAGKGKSKGKGKRKGGGSDDDEDGDGGLRYSDLWGGGGGDGEEDDEGEDDEEEEEPQQQQAAGRGGRGRGAKAGGRGGAAGHPAGGRLSSDEDEEEEEEDEEEGEDGEEEEEGGAARRKSGRDAGTREGGGVKARGGAKAVVDEAVMSSHERRLARLQERVSEVEAGAMGSKSWHLTGEVAGGQRPPNSALELDLDFESTAKPVPAQTDESTGDIEALIRRRITERRFDDVVRLVAAPLEGRKREVDLDDAKAKAGLGELYEQDFVRQTAGGTSEDKDERLRLEAKGLFKALCFKLDALSRFHFAPKPVVEDMTIRSEVPAIAMEEAAPVAVSTAAMQLPSEVYAPKAKDGRPVAEEELTREERKQRRAGKKRARKNKEAAKDAEMRARAVAEGGSAEIVGRKSDSKVVAGKGVRVAEGAGSKRHGRTDVGSSSAVFAKLAAEQAAAAAGGGVKAPKVGRELQQSKGAAGAEGPRKGGAALKL